SHLHALRWSSRAWFGSSESGGLASWLQAELLLALDLHDLTVVHGDLHRAELQAAQGAADFAQDAGFVLTFEVANWRGHFSLRESLCDGRVAVAARRGADTRYCRNILKNNV